VGESVIITECAVLCIFVDAHNVLIITTWLTAASANDLILGVLLQTQQILN